MAYIFSEKKIQLYQQIIMFYKDGFIVMYINIKLKIAKIIKESAKQTQNKTKKFAITNFKYLTCWLAHF